MEKVKIKSTKLFDKYIANSSRYEIILSNATRQKMYNEMARRDWIDDNNVNVNTILELWDDATKELFLLLVDGFDRFHASRQYGSLNLDLQSIDP